MSTRPEEGALARPDTRGLTAPFGEYPTEASLEAAFRFHLDRNAATNVARRLADDPQYDCREFADARTLLNAGKTVPAAHVLGTSTLSDTVLAQSVTDTLNDAGFHATRSTRTVVDISCRAPSKRGRPLKLEIKTASMRYGARGWRVGFTKGQLESPGVVLTELFECPRANYEGDLLSEVHWLVMSLRDVAKVCPGGTLWVPAYTFDGERRARPTGPNRPATGELLRKYVTDLDGVCNHIERGFRGVTGR